jgi:hypothetical protein
MFYDERRSEDQKVAEKKTDALGDRRKKSLFATTYDDGAFDFFSTLRASLHHFTRLATSVRVIPTPHPPPHAS